MSLPLLISLVAAARAGAITPLYEGLLIADGEPLTVELALPGSAPGDRLRVRSDEVAIDSSWVTDEGRYLVRFTPPPRTAPGEVALSVRVRGSQSLDEVLSLPLEPPPTGEVHLSLDPPQVAIGEGDVTVHMRFTGGSHLPPADRRVALAASVGEVSEPVYDGGDWVARYTPPAGLSEPTAALLVATDLSAPERVVGAASLPISPRRGEPFAPDPSGDGALAFAPLPEGVGLPAESLRSAWLYAITPSGEPHTGAAIEIGGPGRTRIEERGGGWYVLSFQAPEAGEGWRLSARLGEASASLEGRSVRDLPALSLSADLEALSGEGQLVGLELRAKDPGGAALPGLAIRPDLTGATAATGSPQMGDRGDGSYTQSCWVPPGTEELRVRITPPLEASGLPPARVLIWPEFDALPADGRSSGWVRAVAEDAYGLPVPGLELDLAVPVGEGTLPPIAETGATGVASARFSAGTATGAAVLEAEVGGVRGRGLAWQGLTPAASTGSEALAERTRRWREATPALILRPEAADPEAGGPEGADAEPPDPEAGGPEVADAELPGPEAGGAEPAVAAAGPIAPAEPLADPVGALRLGLVDQGLSYSLLAPGAVTVPEDTRYEEPLSAGVIGLALSGSYWYRGGDLGLEAAAVLGRYDLDIGSGVEDSISSLTVSGAWRRALGGGLGLRASLGYQGFHTLIFRYTAPDEEVPEVIPYPLRGARTAAGASFARGRLSARADLSATWAPWPIDRSLLIGADYAVSGPWILGLGIERSWRSMDLLIGEVEARLEESRSTLSLQGGVVF